MRTARADLTISLTNGRAPEVAFTPFRALSLSHLKSVVLAKSASLTVQSTLLSSMHFFSIPTRFDL